MPQGAGDLALWDGLRFAGNFVARAWRGEVPDAFSKGDPAFKKGFWSRIQVVAKTTEAMHEECANVPHIYVAMLATDPDCQRRGFGGSLMRAALRAADAAGAAGVPRDGRRQSEVLRGLRGFEVTRTYRLSDGADEGWPDCDAFHAMVRKAKRGTSAE